MSSIFDYVTTINKKVGLFPTDNIDEFESVYNQHLVNMAFCRYADTIMIVDEILQMKNLTNLQHFDYLYITVPKKNRFQKWNKVDKSVEIELLQQIYNYSYDKAKDILPLFNDEMIENLKKKLYEGGRE